MITISFLSCCSGCNAKERCNLSFLSASSLEHKTVLVHAFADVPYRRSSFHFAGTSRGVAEIVSKLVTEVSSCNELQQNYGKINTAQSIHSHPTVGLIDHVAVMPLVRDTTCDGLLATIRTRNNEEESSAATAAHQIGASLEALDCLVYYYGYADGERQASLAEIRRERTRFFNTKGSSSVGGGSSSASEIFSNSGITCVGCPLEFTENFNVRLSFPLGQKDAKKVAMSLTRKLRERDGGLAGVEALTLPYHSNDTMGIEMYEVACNLLKPTVGSADAIQELTQNWMDEMISKGRNVTIDKAYRVGTTATQCLKAFSLAENDLVEHSEGVIRRFEELLAI